MPVPHKHHFHGKGGVTRKQLNELEPLLLLLAFCFAPHLVQQDNEAKASAHCSPTSVVHQGQREHQPTALAT